MGFLSLLSDCFSTLHTIHYSKFETTLTSAPQTWVAVAATQKESQKRYDYIRVEISAKFIFIGGGGGGGGGIYSILAAVYCFGRKKISLPYHDIGVLFILRKGSQRNETAILPAACLPASTRIQICIRMGIINCMKRNEKDRFDTIVVDGIHGE